MASPRERYLREIAKQWGYLVTWLPSRTVRLGQTGRFDGLEVQIDSDIVDVGFALAASHDENATNLEYNTGGAVSFDLTSSASAATGESAELKIDFTRDNAIVMHLHEAVEYRVDNLDELKEAIRTLDHHSAWPKGRAVVISVVRASHATVLISSGLNGAVRCAAAGGQALGNLADPRLGLGLTSKRSMHTTILAAGQLTPMYQGLVLRRGLRGSKVEQALRGVEAIDVSDPLRSAVDDDFALCTVREESAAA